MNSYSMQAQKNQSKKLKALYNSQIREQWHIINDLTNNLVVGRKCLLKNSPAYGRIDRNYREQVFDHIEGVRRVKHKRTLKLYKSHCRGNSTEYYTGTSYYDWEKQPETMFTIDIDCHVKDGVLIGSQRGAKNCIQFLKQWFPSIYWEHSTGGVGIWGWVRLDRKYYTPDELNEFYFELKAGLQRLVPMFDISDIEITGTCPVIKWEAGKIDRREPKEGGSNLGVFGGLPRKPGALSSTTRINVAQLKGIIASINEYADSQPGLNKDKADSNKNKQKASAGSLGLALDIKDYGGTEKWEKLAQELIKKLPQVAAKKKLVVNYRDMGYFLFISWWCSLSENMNADGTMPMDRIEEIWLRLYYKDSIDRQHNHSRAGAMRNCLDSLNMIEWNDNTHSTNKACQWNLTEKVMELIEDILDGTVSLYDTNSLNTYLAVAEIYLKPISEWVRPKWVHDAEAEFIKLMKYFPDSAAA